MYPNFTTFNQVFLSEMLSRERECYVVSSTLTYPVTYTSKKNSMVFMADSMKVIVF